MAAKPAALVSFSGALLVHDHLAPAGSDSDYPETLLVHGTEDAVVPFALMEASAGILAEKGVVAKTVARAGLGHGIDPDGLTAAMDFLSASLPQ